MSDRYATEPTTRPAPNPHDTALAVFRPEVYSEAVDYLSAFDSDLDGLTAEDAIARLRARRDEVAAAPGAGMLDHATAAYYRQAAASLRNAGHEHSARLLEHVADDLDGGQS
ncbi:hypothetical protein [Glycomyces sp. NPDC021274]|uniref:hypothetical protein n=1 Tax=Glycomyces sp. NPDC021274 TaxID=3155120 RepID=UPI0033D96544